MKQFILLFFVLFVSLIGRAQEIEVPTVVIEEGGEAQSPIDSFSVFKSEKVSKEKLKAADRQNLSEIVRDQVGVDSQVYCANCGAKRLTINGLKGEHTSILIDGIPLHSAVSSFYGVDNVPAIGIADISVMRGAGASLTNPEAIGGTLDIQTVDPLTHKSSYLTSVGVDDRFFGKSQNHQIMYTKTGESKKWGLTFGGQFARQEAWDEDRNNVSEAPQRENFSGLAKTRFFLGKKNDFTARVGWSQLEILGGYFDPTKPDRVRPQSAREIDFENGSVENKFIGDPLQITDWIYLRRNKSALTGTHYLSDGMTFEWKLGQARQHQEAIYQHGFDYSNIDNLFVGDTTLKFVLSDGDFHQHFLNLGLFFKDQRLRSSSAVMFTPAPAGLGLAEDSFNFASYAAYAQHSWLMGEVLELDFAVRVDRINVNWLDLSNEVSETVAAPRFQALHNITEHLSQRLSYGLGYRAPLTFFESQHGNQENGYEVDITDLEKAHSFVYSLSYNTPDYYVTGGAHYTILENMAYGFEEFSEATQYRNSEEEFDIWVADLLLGYKPVHWWLIETTFEYFQYDDLYKRRLPTAAIERRLQLKSEMNFSNWTHILRGTLVGSRDLSKYASYNEHFVNRNQALEPALDPNLEKKDQNSPTWFTLDTSFAYKFHKSLVLTMAVNNIFDYTQASAGDTPATWHWHFDHAHFDGLHTWGPNQGRQYILSLSGEF